MPHLPQTVLVLDDEGNLGELVAQVLAEAPALVEVAEPSEHVLSSISRLQPALVVISADSFGRGGQSLIPMVRRAAGRTPLILVSGEMTDRDIKLHEKLRLRADLCLRKDALSKQTLYDALAHHLDLDGDAAPEEANERAVAEELGDGADEASDHEQTQEQSWEAEREAMARAHQQEILELEKAHQHSQDQLAKHHAGELESLRGAAEDKRQRVERELTETRQQHDLQLDQLQREYAKQRQAALAELELQHHGELESLRRENAEARAALIAEHAATIDTLEAEHRQQLSRISEQLDQLQREATEHEEDALAELEQKLGDKLEAMEEKLLCQLGRTTADSTQLEESLAQTLREVSRLHEQCGELVAGRVTSEEHLRLAAQQLIAVFQARERRVPRPSFPRRVLVVGSDDRLIEHRVPLLKRSNIEVFSATSQQEVFELLVTKVFDLVLVDDATPEVPLSFLVETLRMPGIELWSPALLVLSARKPDEQALHELRAKQCVVVQRSDKGAALRAVADALGLHVRIPTRLVAELDLNTAAGHRRTLAQTVNLSLSGLLFKAEDEYDVGAKVDFELAIPGDEPIRGKLRVIRRLEPDKGEPDRYGARFESLTEDGQRRLRRYLGK